MVAEGISIANEKEVFTKIEQDTKGEKRKKKKKRISHRFDLGDLRAAINAMQLFCVGQKAKKSARNFESAKYLDLGKRDSSLSLFHGIGKVFHPKRDQFGSFLVSPEKISAKMVIDVRLSKKRKFLF